MLSMWKVSLFSIVTCCLQICLVFSGENTIRGRRFICGVYDRDLVAVNCSLKKINRTTEFWSFYINYLQPMKNLHINVTNYSQQQNLEYKPQMIINFHIDCCKWIDGSLINKLMDIMKEDLKNNGNAMMKCPQYGLVYMSNMTFHDNKYPPITPSGLIYLDFQYYTYINGVVRRLYFLRPYLEIKYKGINYW